MDISGLKLPGAYLVERGLEDIRSNKKTKHSLLLLLAKTRLQAVGVQFDNSFLNEIEPSTALFGMLQEELGDGAHSMFNALKRELLSFLRASERKSKSDNAATG